MLSVANKPFMLNVVKLSVEISPLSWMSLWWVSQISPLCWVSLCWVLLYRMLHFIYLYDESRYDECHYAECRCGECRYGECRYAECHYTKCRGAANNPFICSRAKSFGSTWSSSSSRRASSWSPTTPEFLPPTTKTGRRASSSFLSPSKLVRGQCYKTFCGRNLRMLIIS